MRTYQVSLVASLIIPMLFGCKTAKSIGYEPQEKLSTETTTRTKDNDKSIVILFDNDVHCNLDGYQHMAGLRDAIRDTAYCETTSSGDYLQGGTAGAISKGQYIIDVMKAMKYAAVTLGNHEFDFKMPHMIELLGQLNTPVVCANLRQISTKKPLYNSHTIIQMGNKKVAFVGAVTPTSLYTEEAAFYDDKGQQIYELCENDFYEVVQKAVDAARNEGADYVILLSHVGEDDNRSHATSHGLIKATNGIDAVLDGHTHSTVSQTIVRNKDGKRVVIAQTGTQFKNVGKLVITKDGKISTQLIKKDEFRQYKNSRVAAVTDSVKSIYNAQVNRKVCHSEVPLLINGDGVQVVRTQETAVGDLVTDAYRILTDADVSITNGGGIRNDLKAGDLTYGDILSLLPYENYLCLVEVKGQKIIDILNATTTLLPAESGDFPQVSGLNFTIDLNATPRVKDIKVLDKTTGKYQPIDPNKTYTIGTMDYCVTGGGLASVLKDAKVLKQNLMLYNEAMIEYVSKNLNGHIGQQYAKPAGRIKIIK